MTAEYGGAACLANDYAAPYFVSSAYAPFQSSGGGFFL